MLLKGYWLIVVGLLSGCELIAPFDRDLLKDGSVSPVPTGDASLGALPNASSALLQDQDAGLAADAGRALD